MFKKLFGIKSNSEEGDKMKHSKLFLITFILTLIISFAQLWANDIYTERYSDRVLIVHSGKIYFDQVICLASSKGLIMIDTGIAPSRTAEYRKIIEREFGRSDFIYVINTHFHFDHTSGNQVFRDAVIIGHESTPPIGCNNLKQSDKISWRYGKLD